MIHSKAILPVLAIGLLATGWAGCESAGRAVDPSQLTCLKQLPTSPSNKHYVSFREPLLPSPLVKLPIGSVEPKGWLRTQLENMRSGMVGHMPELGRWCKLGESAWSSPQGEGPHGWEELPYWLKGYGDLGYVLKDEQIIAEARKWIDRVLSSQREDGFFGPRSNLNLNKGRLQGKVDIWPNMVMCDILQSFHEATGDPRVVPFLQNYCKWQLNLPVEELLPASWQKVRAGDNLNTIYWVYNRTGEKWLLTLADRVHHRTVPWSETWTAGWKHGVNICQCFRQPAQYYMLSKDRKYLDATERILADAHRLHSNGPGLFGADENCRDGYADPRNAAETCSIVEFMRSCEMLLKMTGAAKWGDRCEDAAFNMMPAAAMPDWKGLHYLTAPNQVQLDHAEKAPGVQNPGCMFAYSPGERYRCCQHNVAQVWPYFAEHLWMATHDNGLAAAFFCASSVKAKVADGAEVSIEETTDYPFDETVSFRISTPAPVSFPLYLRIPAWCADAGVEVNGARIPVKLAPESYARLAREWRDGDTVKIGLPMKITTTLWKLNRNSVSVNRGPLTYSLKIGEKWVKNGGSGEWPEWDVFPTTPWNYGLVIDADNPESSVKVARKSGPMAAQPFTPDNAPIELKAKGRKIPEWRLDSRGMCGILQDSPAKSEEADEEITLVPMGCARLRISAFPQIGTDAKAHEWKVLPKFETSSLYRQQHGWTIADLDGVYEGIDPKHCNDKFNRRFGWWDKMGTTEWISATLEAPREISKCEVYWFHENGKGKAKPPESWKLYAKQGGEWKEVEGVVQYGLELNKYNIVKFKPVTTEALKLEVKSQPEMTVGILEWKIE